MSDAPEEPASEVLAPEDPASDLEIPWQRLDPRMLIVQPLVAVKEFFPVMIGAVVLGSGRNGYWQESAVVAFPIVFGVWRYFATKFRVTEGRLELHTGIINRQRRSTPLSRIRTVDLTASIVHRLLGLTTLSVGTSSTTLSDDSLKLDGIRTAEAAALRANLLHRGARETLPEVPASADVRLRLNPKWALYAPFTVFGLAGSLTVVGAMVGFAYNVGADELLSHDLVVGAAIGVVVVLAILALLALVVVIPMATYLVTNWGFTLTRDKDSWSVSRGLFTTHHTSLDESRLAGLVLHEALTLRLMKASSVEAIAAGGSILSDEASTLAPIAPRSVVDAVAEQVLGTSAPVKVPLTTHGPAATRRRWMRGVGSTLAMSAVLCGVVVAEVIPDPARAWASPVMVFFAVVLPVLGIALAWDRSRRLGHALAGGFLVERSGSLNCSRQFLDVQRIIGWRITATFFQRRAGLVDLHATMAGGSQVFTIMDVPEAEALAIATASVPRLVSQFLAPAEANVRRQEHAMGEPVR